MKLYDGGNTKGQFYHQGGIYPQGQMGTWTPKINLEKDLEGGMVAENCQFPLVGGRRSDSNMRSNSKEMN